MRRNAAWDTMIEGLKRDWRTLGMTQDEIHRDAERVKRGQPCFLPEDLYLTACREYWTELQAEKVALAKLSKKDVKS